MDKQTDKKTGGVTLFTKKQRHSKTLSLTTLTAYHDIFSTALQTFSLQKLQVSTVFNFPLQFHCDFYSHPEHAVEHCSRVRLYFKPLKSVV